MKFWILVMAAAALLVWSLVRERFEATDSIKAPPYDEGAKIRIYEVASSANQATLRAKAAPLVTVPTTDPTYQTKLQAAAGGLVAPAVGEFFTSVFKPATTPITNANVTTFMATRTSELKSIEEQVLKAYFVGQQGIGTSQRGEPGQTYADALAALGQGVGYLAPGSTSGAGSSGSTGSTGSSSGAGSSSSTSGAGSGASSASGTSSSTAASTAAAAGSGEWEEGPAPVCPTGTSFRTVGASGNLLSPDEMEKCYGSELITPTCPDGYYADEDAAIAAGTPEKPCHRLDGTESVGPFCPAGFQVNFALGSCETEPVDPSCPGGYQYREGKCMRRRVAPSTTTGGSSTSMQGPTTGGAASRIRQVFGPQFTERGNEVPSNDGDSSQTNVYPELLGGKIDSSSRIPGAGITAPSKNWQLATNGSLPTSKSLGSDAMSSFFPFSRSPGDMDIIPDPYRVSKTFSASSYSSKTEPVPFLTDFSAFQR